MAVIAHSRASRLEKRFRTRSAPNEQADREAQPVDEAGETESPEVSERSQVPRPPRLSSATLRSLQRKQQRAQQQLLQPAALPPPPASASTHTRQAQARSLSSLQAGRLLDAAPAAPRAIGEASGGPALGSFGRLAGVPLDARTGTYLIGRAQDRYSDISCAACAPTQCLELRSNTTHSIINVTLDHFNFKTHNEFWYKYYDYYYNDHSLTLLLPRLYIMYNPTCFLL